ncbi:MAG: FkbM family methyltransferase [Bdellovibrionales bacterium]|nr:FkbM family methyltransferase [Bdellovibrionales bacterium]
MKSLVRKLLRLWAKTGVAPGLLHQYVDQKSSSLHEKPLLKKVYGNNKILCDLRDHVQSRIYFMGAYEPIEAYLFMDLIKPDMHIVDAGANIGFYSLLAASKVSDRGHVFSFEPIPSNYEQFESNILKHDHNHQYGYKQSLNYNK